MAAPGERSRAGAASGARPPASQRRIANGRAWLEQSEGFLPGYNFPALPVRAWVPRLGREGEFIARPRALALTEYAPHNFVYHEGKRWKVDAFQAPPDGLHARRETFKLCRTCGAMASAHQDLCPECRTPLDGANSEILTALEMPNVSLSRSARITSDEEERQRQGYRVQAVYALEGCRQRIVAEACAGDGRPLGELTYALAADLRFVNHGRRGSQHPGFLVNLSTGQLYTEGELQGEGERRRRGRPDVAPTPDRVCLMVRVPQDVLLFRPHDPPRAQEWWLSLGYALRRGIGKMFQLEENELGFEVVGAEGWQRLLFYENAEGSLGVLAQIARAPRALAQCARAALEVCHFDPDSGEDAHPDCAKACYECLLSFDNQLVADRLNRHSVRDTLLRLSRADTLHRYGERSWREQLEFLRARTDPRSELERRLLDILERHRLRLPDQAQHHVPEVGCVADFFYAPRALVFCDGSPHDAPEQRAQDEQVRAALRKHGYTVIALRYDSDLAAQIAPHSTVFGEFD